jgi:hypothetical protein
MVSIFLRGIENLVTFHGLPGPPILSKIRITTEVVVIVGSVVMKRQFPLSLRFVVASAFLRVTGNPRYNYFRNYPQGTKYSDDL